MDLEAKNEVRNWLLRLISLTDNIPLNKNSYNIQEDVLIQLQIHLDVSHLKAHKIIKSLNLYSIINSCFTRIDDSIIKEINRLLDGKTTCISTIDILIDTIFYHTPSFLELEDILNILTNWTRLGRIRGERGKSLKVIESRILPQFEKLRLQPKPQLENYLGIIKKNIRQTRTLNGHILLISIKQTLETFYYHQEFLKIFKVCPPQNAFPGGTSYRESLLAASSFGMQTLIPNIQKVSIQTSWDDIKHIEKTLNIKLPEDKQEAIEYLREYASQL